MGLTRKRDELLGQFPEIAAELLRLRQRHATTPCFYQHIRAPLSAAVGHEVVLAPWF
jgi:hypothetical protein